MIPATHTRQKRKPGRPSSGLDTVQVCIYLRKDQVEKIKDIVNEDLPLPMAKSMNSLVRAAVDDFFAQ